MQIVILLGVSIFFIIVGIIERNPKIIIPSAVGFVVGLIIGYKAIQDGRVDKT